MTKHLRFLFVMLLAMIWSGVMFAQKTETITIADYVPSSGSKAITAEEPLSQNGFKIYIDQNSQSTYKPGIWQMVVTCVFTKRTFCILNQQKEILIL